MRQLILAISILVLSLGLGSCAKCMVEGQCLEEGRRAVYEINAITMPSIQNRYAACQGLNYREKSFGVNCNIYWGTGIVLGP